MNAHTVVTELTYGNVIAMAVTVGGKPVCVRGYLRRESRRVIPRVIALYELSTQRWFEGMDSDEIEADILHEATQDLARFDEEPTQEYTAA
jgi:hypothetical protein